MGFHPLRWIGRRVRAILGYLASRSTNRPFKMGASDGKKATATAAATGTIALGIFSFLADHTGDLPNYFKNPKVVALVAAAIVLIQRSLVLYVQGPTVATDATDPTIPSSIPKDEPPK